MRIICASLQTDNCTSSSSLSFLSDEVLIMLCLTPNQHRKSTEDNISQQLNSMSDAQRCMGYCCCDIQALVKRAQELTPGAQEQAAVLNLVTKIQSVLDNLVVAPSLFEAAVCPCL